jgi:hypothetical protein
MKNEDDILLHLSTLGTLKLIPRGLQPFLTWSTDAATLRNNLL